MNEKNETRLIWIDITEKLWQELEEAVKNNCVDALLRDKQFEDLTSMMESLFLKFLENGLTVDDFWELSRKVAYYGFEDSRETAEALEESNKKDPDDPDIGDSLDDEDFAKHLEHLFSRYLEKTADVDPNDREKIVRRLSEIFISEDQSIIGTLMEFTGRKD